MNIKLIIAILFLSAFAKTLLGQTSSENLFTDNNPKLTEHESQWLNERFGTENFDFTNKYIGFVELASGNYGIGKFTLPLKKKNLAQLDLNEFQHKLVVLDTAQKTMTRGYDALLVLVSKKNEKKLNRLNIENLIFGSMNRYHQMPG